MIERVLEHIITQSYMYVLAKNSRYSSNQLFIMLETYVQQTHVILTRGYLKSCCDSINTISLPLSRVIFTQRS